MKGSSHFDAILLFAIIRFAAGHDVSGPVRPSVWVTGEVYEPLRHAWSADDRATGSCLAGQGPQHQEHTKNTPIRENESERFLQKARPWSRHMLIVRRTKSYRESLVSNDIHRLVRGDCV